MPVRLAAMVAIIAVFPWAQIVAGPLDERPAPAFMTGVIRPREAVDLAADIEARIEALHVELGSRVARGAVVATLDLKGAREELEMARARLKSAEARERLAGVELSVAAGLLNRRARVPDAWSDQEKAEADLEKQRAEAHLEVVRSEVLMQRAQVEQLERRLESGVIRSPFDAVVAERYQHPGAVVEAGTPVVRLVSDGELWVRFAVPEALIDSVHAGRSLEVHLPANHMVLAGTIGRISPEIDASSHLLTVEGPLAVPDRLAPRIRAGMMARVRFAVPGDP